MQLLSKLCHCNMTEGVCWKITILLLCLVSTVWTRLECRPEAVRQLNTSDVATSSIENGPFSTLSGILLGDTKYWWYSSGLSNIGKMNFTETFVLMGLSTQGEYFSDIMDERYVSSFSLEYARSLNESYQEDIKMFNVSTGVERFFYFSEPIVARTLQLVILDAYVGALPTNKYYWFLDIIGCPETEAIEVIEPSSCEDPTPIVIESIVVPNALESHKTDTCPSCSCEIPVSPSTGYNSATVAQSTQSPSPLVNSCDVVQLIAATIPAIVLLIVLVGVILLWIRYCKRSKGSEEVPRENGNTEIYSSRTIKQNDRHESQDDEKVYSDLCTKPRDDSGEDDDHYMIYNELYKTNTMNRTANRVSLVNNGGTQNPTHCSEVVRPDQPDRRFCVGSLATTDEDAYSRLHH